MSSSPQYRFSRQSHHVQNETVDSVFRLVHIDFLLLLLLLLAAAIGMAVLYSASGQNMAMLIRQGISFVVAFVVMLVMSQVPPTVYRQLTPVFYAGGVFLLLLVPLIGEKRMGAQRWISIPGFGSVQPSEFMRLGMPMMIAWFMSQRKLPPNLLSVILALVLVMLPVALIAKQPDLGTSLLVAASGIFVIFLAGLSWRLIAIAAALAAPLMMFAWQYILHDYQRLRVMTLLNPNADPMGAGWNIIQSKTAIGSGGVFGKGYLNGTQSHLHFLPEGHTDFVIAAFAEEFGLIGVGLLLLLYFCIISRILYIANRSQITYARLLAGAIGLSFFVYVFVNVGMVSGLLPVVGVPLPFISYGGTALVTLMAGFGLIMSIDTHRQY